MLTGTRPPPGLARLLGDPWRVGALPGFWTPLLTEALKVRRQERPADVKAWWEGRALGAAGSATTAAPRAQRTEPAPPPLAPTAPPHPHPLARRILSARPGET